MGSGCSKFKKSNDNKVEIPRNVIITIPQRQSQFEGDYESDHIAIFNYNEEIKQQQKYQIGFFFLSDQFKQINDKYIAIKTEQWQEFIQKGKKITKINLQQQDKLEYFTSQNEIDLYKFQLINKQKFRKFVIEMIPQKFRWTSWKILLFPIDVYEKNQYQKQVSIENENEDQIIKDLHRTFPGNQYYSPQEQNQIQAPPGQEIMFRVLKAVANYFPQCGYCQGMNFIIGFLLLVNGGQEEETFWAFVNLGLSPQFKITGFYQSEFPLVFFYIYVFKRTLEQKYKKLFNFVSDIEEEFPDVAWIYKWFSTIFLYTFPNELVIIFWDYIFSESLVNSIKIAISIMRFFEKDILQMEDHTEFQNLLQGIKTQTVKIDCNQVMSMSKDIKISQKELNNYALQYIEKFTKEKENSNNFQQTLIALKDCIQPYITEKNQ